MRRRLLDVLFLLTAAALVGWLSRPPANPESRLYGAWMFRDGNEQVVLTFNPDHTLVVRLEDGKLERANYRTDFSVVPAQMDVVLSGKDTVRTIFELMPDGRLRLMDSNPGKIRPTSFSERAFVMTRQPE